jgi:putative Holliday junction resolvase
VRIMALDVGTKRIGVALSDELFITAQGRETIACRDTKRDLDEIAAIIAANGVCEVVVGLPLNMNGTNSRQTEEVLLFVEELTKAVSVPVKKWDERLTSVQAERAMLEADMSRAKRRRLSDKVAAQLILQAYLDSRRRG